VYIECIGIGHRRIGSLSATASFSRIDPGGDAVEAMRWK
jgi:hypothetical protein